MNYLLEKHNKGVERLEQFLNINCQKKTIRLSKKQVENYKTRGAKEGWVIQLPDTSYRMIIFVDNRFPFSIPKTAIEPAPEPLKYPHIEKDGYLCVAENAVPKDENAIEKVAHYVLAESLELVNKCISGGNQKDFQDEILSYWDRSQSDNASKCYSLLDLEKDRTAKKIKIWKGINGEAINFVADTINQGEKWLNQKLVKYKKQSVGDALFAWSGKVLLPEEYPSNNKQVYDFLKNHCDEKALKIYQELAENLPNKIDIIIGFETDTGNALVGIELDQPVLRTYKMTSRQALRKGFRKNSVNPVIVGNRYASEKTESQRLIVQRVDPAWALSRDSDARIKTLEKKTVTIIGCGSVGSEIVRMLAQNGVGTFNLIDPDSMEWENIGRHTLGAKQIVLNGKSYKTDVLKSVLTSQFPHIKIRSAYPDKWENILASDTDAFHKSDLVLMATGDWPAENAMNKYMLEQKSFPPVLYGWAEAYALGGHSFAVLMKGGCFNCAFDDTTFKFKLTEFEEEHQQLPACGGVFQPYRSIELAPINSVIAAHAIDILTGKVMKSQIRSWIGSNSILLENNGQWTKFANQEISSRGAFTGQFVQQFDFDKISACSACGNK